MKHPLIIIGAGGFAGEVFSWVDKSIFEVLAFYDQSPKVAKLFGVPVISTIAPYAFCEFVVAVGDPTTRERLWNEAVMSALVPCMPIVHKSALIGEMSTIGRGVVVCPNVVVTSLCVIGSASILNLGATVGHETIIGDFVTVSPGANISGRCNIGNGAYIGTNSAIRENLSVGIGATVGMGAVLTKNVPDGQTWVGNPAKPLTNLATVSDLQP